MSKVAVDIDDTLYCFSSLAQDMMIKIILERGENIFQRGAYHSWNEWRTPADLLEGEWQSIIDMCHRDHVIRSQMPFKNAVTVMRKIFDMGNDIIYISNRSEDAYDATYKWLQAHGFPQSKSLVCTTEDKSQFIEDCQYIIDDRPKTLVQFVYDHNWHGKMIDDRKAFGLLCEYNRALTDVPGIYLAPNWTLLEKYIEEKSDLLGYRNTASISFSS